MSREMKQSGVPWLKDIPSNWNVERGKNVLVLQKRPVRESDEVVTCFRDGEVILRSLRRTEGFTMSDKEIGYQGINEGDIVIHGMDGFAGAMGVSKSTGKGSPVLVVCSPKYDAIPQYIIYYLRALAMTDVFIALATGIRERSCDLRWNKISELEFILPSSIEQQKIASFLDRKCAEIDEMIALQEKIVEELKAYKQSVITEAVTKGLNPDVPMKDSGIEWIGEIPEHWKVDLLSLLFEEHKQKNTGLLCKNLLSLSYGKIVRKNIDSVGGLLPQSYDGYNIVDKGDIVFRLTDLQNDKKSLRTGLVRERGIVTSAYVTLRSRKPVLSAYYQYLFHSYDVMKVFYGMGDGVRQGMNYGDLRKMLIVTPPHSEQNEIVEFLDTKCTEIDNLISIKLSKIDSLNEYKKSIIYEYVTGKKEVIE